MKKSIFLIIALLAFPLAMQATDHLFYVSFASRVMIYLIMAIVLYFRPQGLFPARG